MSPCTRNHIADATSNSNLLSCYSTIPIQKNPFSRGRRGKGLDHPCLCQSHSIHYRVPEQRIRLGSPCMSNWAFFFFLWFLLSGLIASKSQQPSVTTLPPPCWSYALAWVHTWLTLRVPESELWSLCLSSKSSNPLNHPSSPMTGS